MSSHFVGTLCRHTVSSHLDANLTRRHDAFVIAEDCVGLGSLSAAALLLHSRKFVGPVSVAVSRESDDNLRVLLEITQQSE